MLAPIFVVALLALSAVGSPLAWPATFVAFAAVVVSTDPEALRRKRS